MAKSEWAKVRSEDELRPGMVIRHSLHGRLILIAGPLVMHCPRCGEMAKAWRDTVDNGFACYREAVAAGDVYRLRDLDEADETTEDARTKETTTR